MLNAKSIIADQPDVNDSLEPRVDITAKPMSARIPVNPRIEYLRKGKIEKYGVRIVIDQCTRIFSEKCLSVGRTWKRYFDSRTMLEFNEMRNDIPPSSDETPRRPPAKRICKERRVRRKRSPHHIEISVLSSFLCV